ncbi:MAG TPA: cyclase [Actinobacteria bacterium]|nr:cyclase [Actinomycetota bacterium]
MTTVFVRAKVQDFGAWKTAYDSGIDIRTAAGVTTANVFRSVDDPNEITVAHELPTVRSAKDFAHSSELRAAMQASGVVGAPEVWFVEGI